ncbi:MAG: ribosomal L7Ae/L30e/S12e/Gadd45 family protein [Clostridia bacterium]|nr:ribosomal L7Ae/L30e/S12e/Gadd45 family protein [Clostridia bacterium]
MNDPVLGFLGLCRRAGRLSLGHDECKPSINSGRAKVCLVASDASERLKEEMRGLSERRDVPFFAVGYTMDTLRTAVGQRTAVITANDENLALPLINKLNENKSGEERDL